MSGELFSLKLDDSAIKRIEIALAAAAKQAPEAAAKAINHTGNIAKTAVGRALVQQTGLKSKTIRKFLHTKQASVGELLYRMSGRGGNVSLLYFKPREVGSGTRAYPWGKRTFYPAAFRRSGPSGHRFMVKKLHGQVFKNIEGGKWGGKIEKMLSGLFIPEELVKGSSLQAFDDTVATRLPARVEYEVLRILNRVVG